MFRVVTYNIRGGLGLDGVRSIRRIAEVLASLSPDIVCLQEVDQRIPRSWLSNQPKYLSSRLGMQAAFQRNINYGIGGYGNCVLVRPHVVHCRCHRLPGDGEPRGALEVKCRLDDQEITVLCTHLSVDERARAEQARSVLEITRKARCPKLLCGDMNDVMSSQTLSTLLEDPVLRDSALELNAGGTPTYPPESSRIDYVLADLRFTVKSYWVIECDASDHRPVVADLDFA